MTRAARLALAALGAILLLAEGAAAQLRGTAPGRLPSRPDERPQIAIVIDDLGLDWVRFRSANRLPMPVTLSFLPYGADAQAMLDAADPRHEVMLHLPMEPHRRKHDAGPDPVRGGDEAAARASLWINLKKLQGFEGVNNHTGSLVTEDKRVMRTVLSEIDRQGLYFLDSRTSERSVARETGEEVGADVLTADLFLDGDLGRGGKAHVVRQLALLAELARARGSAVAIGHPYPATLDALTLWAAENHGRFIFVTTGELAGRGGEGPRDRPRLRG